MQVMTNHKWHDMDVSRVLFSYDGFREIVLKDGCEGSVLLSERDVIAIAKEFGLVVYRKDAAL